MLAQQSLQGNSGTKSLGVLGRQSMKMLNNTAHSESISVSRVSEGHSLCDQRIERYNWRSWRMWSFKEFILYPEDSVDHPKTLVQGTVWGVPIVRNFSLWAGRKEKLEVEKWMEKLAIVQVSENESVNNSSGSWVVIKYEEEWGREGRIRRKGWTPTDKLIVQAAHWCSTTNPGALTGLPKTARSPKCSSSDSNCPLRMSESLVQVAGLVIYNTLTP